MPARPLIWAFAAAAVAAAAGYVVWRDLQGTGLPEGFARANGRLEAEQVEIATKFAGRVAEVLVEEGQTVDAGTVVARMDTRELDAQLRAAEAQARRAEHEKMQAQAAVAQRRSELAFAEKELDRAVVLHERGYYPTEKVDDRQTQLHTAQAAYNTALAVLDAAEAAIDSARAEVARLESMIEDMTLVAPRRGRIEYKLAQAGEVLGAGGRVVTLLDITDVYMTIFLPAAEAGRLALNDEARIVLDPVPQYVIPAKVTFVATEAQFTPKSVETAEEREKLMFRVKLTIPPDLLLRYEKQVKTGVRGVGYVRTRRDAVWPESLAVKLPP